MALDRMYWLRKIGLGSTSTAATPCQMHGRYDIPATWQEFGDLMDAYERDNFGYDEGAVTVSEATLALMATFPPNDKGPRRAVRRSALALMDDALLAAFRYDAPTRAERVLYRRAIKARARLLRHVPARKEPVYFRDLPQVRSYPEGYEIPELGTFADTRT